MSKSIGFYSLPFLFLLVDYVQALKNAALTYRDYKPSWEGLMKRGMQRNCTWENAAIQYEQVFEWACFDPPYVN
jgi:starch synthase